MAEVAGKGGDISFTNAVTSAKSWTLSWTGDLEDITDFDNGSAGYKRYLHTLKDWTATAEGSWDIADTAEPGDSATLTLTPVALTTYSGTAIVLSTDITAVVSGIVTGTISFQGNGALTLATTT